MYILHSVFWNRCTTVEYAVVRCLWLFIRIKGIRTCLRCVELIIEMKEKITS